MNHTASRADISYANNSAITPPAGHYSHVCIAAGQIFISGQLPIQPDGTPLTGRSFEEQTAQVLANIEACLACAGVGKESLVQVRIYVTDIKHWPTFNQLYATWGRFRKRNLKHGKACKQFWRDQTSGES